MKVASIVILVVVILAGAGFFFLQSKKDSAKPQTQTTPVAAVAGKFDLNGPIPAGATLSVAQRVSEQGDFVVFDPGIAAQDGAAFHFEGAKENVNYDLQASLKINGEVATSSAILTVTAPATDEVLTINYSPKVAAAPSASPIPGPITGHLDLNGYIPAGSIVTLQRKGPSDANFVLIGSPFIAQDQTSWIWKEPQSGVHYHIKAILSSGSNKIGESDIIHVTAPASGEEIKINSTAKAPATGGTGPSSVPASSSAISGSVNLNGAAPKGGSIVVLQRTPPGKGSFQVAVDGVQPVNGSQWAWNQAASSTQYELVAVLKDANKNDVASSQSLISTAPASNEVFNINSSLSLAAPTQAITFACVGKNSSNNTWNVNVNNPTIPGALSYWFQIGTSNGGSELLNTVQNASNNPSQIITATFNDSVTYYAKYAYSYNSNASYNSGFSAFSNTNSFKCPQ